MNTLLDCFVTACKCLVGFGMIAIFIVITLAIADEYRRRIGR